MKDNGKQHPATGLSSAPPMASGGGTSLPAAAMGGALACLGTLGMAGAFVTAFDLPIPLWLLACASLLFPALWTVVHFSGRLRLPLTLVLLVGCGLALWMLGEPFIQGFLHTVNRMFQAFAAHTSWIFPQYFTQPSTWVEVEQNIALFGLLTLFPWSGLVAWAAGRRVSFLLSLLLTLPCLAVGLYFYLDPALWAVVCLLLFWAALAFAHRSPGRATGTAVAAIPALGLTLLLLLILAPKDGYVRPVGMEDFRLQAEELARTVPGALSEVFSGMGGGRGILTYDQRRRSFQGLGRASFTGRTDLRVKTEEIQEHFTLYLKGFTGTTYDSGGWSALPDSVLEEFEAAAAPIHPQNLTAEANPDLTRLELTVENLVNPKVVYAPWALMSTPEELPDINFMGDAALRAKPFLGLERYTLRYGVFFSTDDMVLPELPLRDPETVSALTRAYEEVALEYYTQVPESLGPVLDGVLAEIFAPEVLIMEEAGTPLPVLVRGYFQSTGGYSYTPTSGSFSYTLIPGGVPMGRDLTEYFLTESKQGYCVYFATAATLLIRQMGIPARYCEGYMVTPDELSQRDAEGFTNVPDRRAHAWVEYYTGELGWVILDVTPGFSGGEAPPNNSTNEVPPTPRPTTAPTSTPEVTPAPTPETTPTPTAAPTATPAPTSTPAPGAGASGGGIDLGPLWAVLRVLVWPGTAVLLLAAWRRLALALRRRSFAGEGNRATLARYALLERLAPWAGPSSAELTALAEKARFSSHRLTEAEVGLMATGLEDAQKRAMDGANPLQKLWLRYGSCLV